MLQPFVLNFMSADLALLAGSVTQFERSALSVNQNFPGCLTSFVSLHIVA